MLHTTTNLTLYRVLSCGESSGTVFRVPTFAVKSFRRHFEMMSSNMYIENLRYRFKSKLGKTFENTFRI